MDEYRIKEMISDFSNTFNAFYTNPPSEKNNYDNWPLRFSGEEREMADRIYDTFQRKTSGNSELIFHIDSLFEQEIIKKILG